MIIRKLSPYLLGSFAALLVLTANQSAMAQEPTMPPKPETAQEPGMSDMWGSQVTKLRADGAKRGELFDVGNYAMFIHWGLYSQKANLVDGKTYYGIGEWIMEELRKLDEVAYIRFASVYRRFEDVAAFREAIEILEKTPDAKTIANQLSLLNDPD